MVAAKDNLDDDIPELTRPSRFLPKAEGEVVSWRSIAPTDASKHLSVAFDKKFGGGEKKGGKKGAGWDFRLASDLRKMSTNKRVLEEKKPQRNKLERKLLLNLEREGYASRSVENLTYRLPSAHLSMSQQSSDAEGFDHVDSDTESEVPSVGSVAGGAGSEDEAPERWPIPVSGMQFNPRLLLSYSFSRIVLPSGENMLKRFMHDTGPCRLLLHAFWFVHCKFFQEDSEEEQLHLLTRLSGLYTQLMNGRTLGPPSKDPQKDTIFKFFPYIIAHAIFTGFWYLCPGIPLTLPSRRPSVTSHGTSN